MALRYAGGMYRLVDRYRGNLIRLRRVSDSAESDFGMNAQGFLDSVAVNAWIGGSSAKVVTLYDQSGSGNHLTQATAADQPNYSAAGYPGSKPAVKFERTTASDGTKLAYADGGASAGTFNADMMMVMAYEPNAINVGIQTIMCKAGATGGASAGEFAYLHTASLSDGKPYVDRPNVEAGVRATAGMTVGAHQVLSFDITGTSVRHFKDGVANGTDTLANGTATARSLQVGAGDFSDGTQQDPARGYMRALMLWDNFHQNTRVAAETAMINETVASSGTSRSSLNRGPLALRRRVIDFNRRR